MHAPGLGVGRILLGLLALGGARRKIAQQPDWVALNWKSYVKGLAGWLVLGAIAVLAGIVLLLL